MAMKNLAILLVVLPLTLKAVTATTSQSWRITCGITAGECNWANANYWIVRHVSFFSDTACTNQLSVDVPISSGECCSGEGTFPTKALDDDTASGWQASSSGDVVNGGGGLDNAWIGVTVSSPTTVGCVKYRNGYAWGYTTDTVYLEALTSGDVSTGVWSVQNGGQALPFTGLVGIDLGTAVLAPVCAAGSPADCTATTISLVGTYAPGGLLVVTDGNDVYKTTDANSCPDGWKLFAPTSRDDWATVLASTTTLPKSPHSIVDVTRTSDGCGGCTGSAMNSGVPAQSSWVTEDGMPWFLRSTPYKEPSGDYTANCYLHVLSITGPDEIYINDGSCDYHSSSYLCQPYAPTVSPTTSPTTTPTVSPTTSPTTTPTVLSTTSPTTTPTVSPTTSPTTTPTVSPTTSPTTICDLRVDSDDIEKTWMSEYTISDGVVTVKVQEELEWIIENEEPTLTGQMVACISGFAWSYAEEGCDYREWTGAIGINALLQCSSGVAEDVSVVDGPDISRMRVEFEMSSLRNVEYYMAGVGDPTSIITTRNTLMPMLFDFQKTINVESQNIAVTSMYFPVTEVVATLTGSDDGEPLTDDEKDEITNSIAAHFNFPSAAIKFTFAESGSIVVTAQVPSDVSTTCAALTFTSFSAVVECAVGEDFASIREVTERSVISVGWTEGSISGLTAEANLKVYTNMQVPYELVNPQHKNQNSALTYSAFETTGTCSLNVDCEKYFEWTLTDDHASPVCTFSGSYEVEFDVVCSQEYNGYVCPLVGNETITTTVSLESGYHCPDTENAVDIALLATELFSNRVDSDDSETVTDSFLNTQTLKFHADVRADNAGLKDAKFIAISIADVNGGVDLELYNGGLTDSGTLLALAVTDIIDSSTDPESDSSVLSPSFTLIADADTLGLDLQETAVFQVTATIAAVYEADGVRRRALLQVSYDASTETSRTVIISAEDAAMQVLEESAAHNSVSAGLWLALLSVYTAFALHF